MVTAYDTRPVVAEQVKSRGRFAEHVPERATVGQMLPEEAKAGDRILIMGARDDTLIDFAQNLVTALERA